MSIAVGASTGVTRTSHSSHGTVAHLHPKLRLTSSDAGADNCLFSFYFPLWCWFVLYSGNVGAVASVGGTRWWMDDNRERERRRKSCWLIVHNGYVCVWAWALWMSLRFSGWWKKWRRKDWCWMIRVKTNRENGQRFLITNSVVKLRVMVRWRGQWFPLAAKRISVVLAVSWWCWFGQLRLWRKYVFSFVSRSPQR